MSTEWLNIKILPYETAATLLRRRLLSQWRKNIGDLLLLDKSGIICFYLLLEFCGNFSGISRSLAVYVDWK